MFHLGGETRSYSDNLDTPLGNILGGLLGGVTSNAADLELLGKLGIVEDGVDDGTTLVSGGTENSDQLGHGERVVVVQSKR